MGSIHFLPKSAYPLAPALRRAFAESELIVFEIDLGKTGQIDNRIASLKSGFFPRGQTLSRELTPLTMALLRENLPSFGLAMEEVGTMRPWYLSDLLMSRYLEKNGYRAEWGVDRYFYRLAQKKGKRIAQLESVSQQIAPFKNLTANESDRYLRETLLSFAFVDLWMQDLLEAWQTGNLKSLESSVATTSNHSNQLHHAVFDQRNEAWLPIIKNHLRGHKNVLIIAGSGHFLGHGGIVRRLEREGFRVDQW